MVKSFNAKPYCFNLNFIAPLNKYPQILRDSYFNASLQSSIPKLYNSVMLFNNNILINTLSYILIIIVLI